MPERITILGIDPGIRNMGWAIVKQGVNKHLLIRSGSFTTESNSKDKMEMFASFAIAKEIERILRASGVMRVYIEGAKPYGKQVKWSTIAGMSAAFTAVAFGAWGVGIQREHIAYLYAQEWRTAIGLKGATKKKEAYRWVSRLVDGLPAEEPGEHECDAICIATAGANRAR